MQILPPQWRNCIHCNKKMSLEEYARTGICPSCKKSVNAPPTPEKGQFINPDDITKKDLVRIDDWAIKLMRKHEHRFSKKIPIGKIFIDEQLKPEDVDIPQIYDFRELHYQIYRKSIAMFAIRILQGGRVIVDAGYEKT